MSRLPCAPPRARSARSWSSTPRAIHTTTRQGWVSWRQRRSVPVTTYRHRDSRNGNRPAAYANRKPSVSGPYRLAISAGSALVPPSAARSDAAAGSTRWRQVLYPAKPCGSPKGRHHTMNRTWAAPRSRASSGLQEWISPTPFRFRGYVLGGRDLRSLAASRRSTAHHGECRVARGLRAQNGPNYRF